jgi:hypothetical protein
VLRAISWGMTILQDKRTQMILIAVGAAILFSLAGAFFGWQNMQAQGNLGNQIADLKEVVIAGFNKTVGR